MRQYKLNILLFVIFLVIGAGSLTACEHNRNFKTRSGRGVVVAYRPTVVLPVYRYQQRSRNTYVYVEQRSYRRSKAYDKPRSYRRPKAKSQRVKPQKRARKSRRR